MSAASVRTSGRRDNSAIPGIIQYRRISPPDPQVFAGLEVILEEVNLPFELVKARNARRSDQVQEKRLGQILSVIWRMPAAPSEDESGYQ
jgi:hypothetical protein